MRRLAVICVVGLASLAGCQETDRVECGARGGVARIRTFSDMARYLRCEEPVGLESVELWRGKYGEGLKIGTAHYEIFTTLLEPLMLRRLAGFMESAYEGYNSQLPEPIETSGKSRVYLFADRGQWEDFTRGFAGEQAELFCKIKAGAYYHNGACVTYNIGSKRTFSALGHEGWHQFNSRHFEFRLPSWLDEGVAMLFEAYSGDSGEFRFDPSENEYRLQGLGRTLRSNSMIPLRELVSINPGEVLATDETEAVTAFYSQSYALVRFVREGAYGTMLGDYLRLVQDGLRGEWPIDEVSKRVARDRNEPRTVLWNRIVGRTVFTAYIGRDFDRIEKEYLKFCGRIVGQ